MKTWRERYEVECGIMTHKLTFKEWIQTTIREDTAIRKPKSQIVPDIVVGPGDKGHLCTMYWTYGSHFCIIVRD